MNALSTLTFAGHSAVFIEAGDKTIAIDPWLESNPKCPENLKNPEKIDLIVLTHGHSDHASDAARLAKSYGSTLAATYELAVIMVSEGVPEQNVQFMNKGGTIEWEGLKITLTNAFHSSSYDTANGPVYAGEPCGVILQDGSFTIYHAGDTCLFKDMKLIGKRYEPDLALLPIGDRFTMGPEEAAKAAKYVRAKAAIPIHFGTFPLLTGTAEEFKEACLPLGIDTITLQPGESYTIASS